MIRVLVADDFPLVRDALVAALGRNPGIEVVGTAADGAEALDKARELRPDVVVLDVRMPGMSGLTALGHLTNELPGVRVLFLSAAAERDVVIEAVSAGAAGYLAKRVSGDELAAAVAAVHRGEVVISPSLVGHLLSGLRYDDHGGNDDARGRARTLTQTERELLRLVAEGRSDREIARQMFISPRTVQSHLTRIRAKVGLRRRVDLTRWAAEHEIVPAPNY